MNQLLLIGRLATEPKLVDTPTHLCTFRIAVKHVKKNGEDETDFFTVVAWGALADACHSHLDVGREISVAGRVRNRSYVKDDETHWVTEVIADRIEFLGRKKPKATHESSKAVVEQTTTDELNSYSAAV